MTDDDICWLSATALGRQIRARKLTSGAATSAHLNRIARIDPKLEAYITVTAERALADAAAADAEIAAGDWRGPLHGVPYCLKDIVCTKGIRTTAGSEILSDWIPDEDARVVRLLNAAGAVLLGKVNTHEFAFGATTQNTYGQTRNPWNSDRLPGGSSGGSGAALAAGLAMFSIGSDTAGSIRMPSAFCGVAGLKPSYGLVSTDGVVAQSYTSDHVGPMARSVEDLVLVMDVLAEPPPGHPASALQPDFTALGAATLDGLKVGIPAELMTVPLDPAVQECFNTITECLEAQGAVIREVSIPLLARATEINSAIVPPETMAQHQCWQATWFQGRTIRYGQDVSRLLAAGAAVPGTATLRAQRERDMLRQQMAAVFVTQADILITPTQPLLAVPRSRAFIDLEGGAMNVLQRIIHFLCGFSLTGVPALAVPSGFSPDGLPVSVQIVGPYLHDARVLAVGMALERVLDVLGHRPPL